MYTQTEHTRNYTVLIILVWFCSALIGGWFGFFSQLNAPPSHLALFIAMPLLGFSALYKINADFRAFTHSISLPLIVGSHVWRSGKPYPDLLCPIIYFAPSAGTGAKKRGRGYLIYLAREK